MTNASFLPSPSLEAFRSFLSACQGEADRQLGAAQSTLARAIANPANFSADERNGTRELDELREAAAYHTAVRALLIDLDSGSDHLRLIEAIARRAMEPRNDPQCAPQRRALAQILFDLRINCA